MAASPTAITSVSLSVERGRKKVQALQEHDVAFAHVTFAHVLKATMIWPRLGKEIGNEIPSWAPIHSAKNVFTVL